MASEICPPFQLQGLVEQVRALFSPLQSPAVRCAHRFQLIRLQCTVETRMGERTALLPQDLRMMNFPFLENTFTIE